MVSERESDLKIADKVLTVSIHDGDQERMIPHLTQIARLMVLLYK